MLLNHIIQSPGRMNTFIVGMNVLLFGFWWHLQCHAFRGTSDSRRMAIDGIYVKLEEATCFHVRRQGECRARIARMHDFRIRCVGDLAAA